MAATQNPNNKLGRGQAGKSAELLISPLVYMILTHPGEQFPTTSMEWLLLRETPRSCSDSRTCLLTSISELHITCMQR